MIIGGFDESISPLPRNICKVCSSILSTLLLRTLRPFKYIPYVAIATTPLFLWLRCFHSYIPVSAAPVSRTWRPGTAYSCAAVIAASSYSPASCSVFAGGLQFPGSVGGGGGWVDGGG